MIGSKFQPVHRVPRPDAAFRRRCCLKVTEVEISTHVGTLASRWRCFLVLHQGVRPEAIRDAGRVYQMAVKSAQNLYRHGRSALIYLFLLRVDEFSKIP